MAKAQQMTLNMDPVVELYEVEYPYFYAWGNNEKRKTLRGRDCQVISRGKKNSIKIRFRDGQEEIVSRYSVRKWGVL